MFSHDDLCQLLLNRWENAGLLRVNRLPVEQAVKYIMFDRKISKTLQSLHRVSKVSGRLLLAAGRFSHPDPAKSQSSTTALGLSGALFTHK